MKNVFNKKCMNPAFFSSIKYAIHSLDDEVMNEKLLSIVSINPYLAAICYNSSETNNNLKELLVKAIENYRITTELEGIMVTMAVDALELDSETIKNSAADTFFFNAKNGEDIQWRKKRYFWGKIDTYWKCRYERIILENGMYWLLPTFYSLSKTTYLNLHEQIELLRLLYKTDWTTFFFFIESNYLYNYVSEFSVDVNYSEKLIPAIREALLYHKHLNPLMKKNIYDAMRKLLAIYVLNSSSPEINANKVWEMVDKINKNVTGKRRKNLYKESRDLIQNLSEVYRPKNHNSLFNVHYELSFFWDKKANGVDKPYAAYIGKETISCYIVDGSKCFCTRDDIIKLLNERE